MINLNSKIKKLLQITMLMSIFALKVQAQEAPIHLSAKNTTIAIDIHDVVLHKNVKQRAKIRAQLNKRIKKEIWKYVKKLKWVTAGNLIKDIAHLKYYDTSGEGFYHIFKKYGMDECANLVRAIARAYDISTPFVKLIKELENRGYTVKVCSNIGKNFYKDLVEDYPKFFNKEKSGVTVDFTNRDGSFNWDMIRKPSPLFFKKHYDQFVRGTYQHVIFIDDKKENITAANKWKNEKGDRPWIGIQMPAGSPDQAVAIVRQRLAQLGLFDSDSIEK